MDAAKLAQQIAQAASENAHSRHMRTPFAEVWPPSFSPRFLFHVADDLLPAACVCVRGWQEARRARMMWQGGKPDDITVRSLCWLVGLFACTHALSVACCVQVVVSVVKGLPAQDKPTTA